MLEFSHKCLEYAICMMCVIWQQVPESFTISLYSCELAQLSFKLQCGLIIWITKGNETKRSFYHLLNPSYFLSVYDLFYLPSVLCTICSIFLLLCTVCSFYHLFNLSSILRIIYSIYHLFYVPFHLFITCSIYHLLVKYHLFYVSSVLFIICCVPVVLWHDVKSHSVFVILSVHFTDPNGSNPFTRLLL